MEDSAKKLNKERFALKVRWHTIESLMNHTFPVQRDYYGSCWDDREERIKEGHKKEIEWLEKQSQSWTNTDYEFGEVFGEDYVRLCDLTNSMYAALVVSIWSKMESFLMRLVRTSYSILGKQKKTPTKIKQIKKAFENELGIRLERCKFYSTVDAVRLLNNFFKHDDGYCNPQSEKYKKIKKSPMARRTIPDRRKRDTRWRGRKIEIKYSVLPIQDIILACNTFCTDLLKKVKSELKNRPAITSREALGYGE